MLSKTIKTIFKSQLRHFAANDGFKSKTQMRASKSEFLNRELKENPEFFKAFPHLQKPIYDSQMPDANSQEYMNDLQSNELFDKSQLKSQSNEDGYFQSLLHHHNKYLTPDHESEEMIRDNETSFVDGYQGPAGPFKYMTEEAKEKVH